MTHEEKLEIAKLLIEKIKSEMIIMEQELLALGIKSNEIAIEYTTKNDAIRNKASELLLLQQINLYITHFDSMIERYKADFLKEDFQ